MKNRSLKAGGRLKRWSFKAGFTVFNIILIFPKFSRWSEPTKWKREVLLSSVWVSAVQVHWLVQRFRSERMRVWSPAISDCFSSSAHVRRQSLPVWPPVLNETLLHLPSTCFFGHFTYISAVRSWRACLANWRADNTKVTSEHFKRTLKFTFPTVFVKTVRLLAFSALPEKPSKRNIRTEKVPCEGVKDDWLSKLFFLSSAIFQIRTPTRTHMHARTHTHTCTRMRARTCVHARACAHTHTHAHARARTHTHTHTKTNKQTNNYSSWWYSGRLAGIGCPILLQVKIGAVIDLPHTLAGQQGAGAPSGGGKTISSWFCGLNEIWAR